MKMLAVTFLAMLVWGCISSEQLKQELAEEIRAACGSPGFKPGTWGFDYCTLRTLYLRKVALGGGSSTGVSAAVTIDNNRRECLYRVEAWKPERSVQQDLDEVIAGRLSGLIERYGEAAGTKEWERQKGVIQWAFEEAVKSGMREECDKAAVEAYRDWLPVLLQSDAAVEASSTGALQEQQRLRQIEARQRQIENQQRWIEQQQRNLQGCLQNYQLGVVACQ